MRLGWGGAFGLAAGELALKSHIASTLPRILVYKLGGNAVRPALPAAAQPELNPPPETASSATVIAGKKLYHTFCSTCHGDSATGSGVLPDLRYSGVINSPEAFDMTVRQGTRVDKGMVAFKDEISTQDLESIRAYLIHRANEDKKAEAAASSGY